MRIPLQLRYASAIHRANSLQRKYDEARATLDLLQHQLSIAQQERDAARAQAEKLAERLAK